MKVPVAVSLVCVGSLVAGLLLTGCGYERYPVRVHQNLPEPGSSETFLTYALRVAPPWPDGGHLIISLPSRITSNWGATSLFSCDDLAFILPCPKCPQATLFTGPAGSKMVHCTACNAELHVLPSYARRDVWEIAPNERTAVLDLESPSTPGVHLRIDVKVAGPRMDFALTLENKTDKDLHNLSSVFSYDHAKLTGFPGSGHGLANCMVLVDGKLTGLDKLDSPAPGGLVRTVLVKDASAPATGKPLDNLSATQIDRALVVLAEPSSARKVLIRWQPGELVTADSEASRLCVNPRMGDLPAGQSIRAIGLILFSQGPVEDMVKEALR